MKIAVITDLHYAKEKNLLCPERAGERAKELLALAVEKLNSEIQPDILLVGGDLVNAPNDLELLRELNGLLEKVQAPILVIPGNHDPAPEIFYTIFPEVPEFLDIKGIRFLAFPRDEQTPECNAVRKKEDILRTLKFSGEMPTVLFQHVPLYKNKTLNCFYRYENAEEILQNCGNTVLSISGHEHAGFMPSFASPFPVIVVPALCEGRFPIEVIEVDGKTGRLQSCKLEFLA